MAVNYVDLLVLGLAIASIGVLGFLVYFHNPQSATNRAFLGFSTLSSVWGVLNYISTQVESPELSIWMWRLVIFAAVWFCFGIYHLARIFPKEQPVYGRSYTLLVLPAVSFVSLLTLTPLVFEKLKSVPVQGTIPAIQNGPLIGLFGLAVIVLVSAAVYKFVHCLFHSTGNLRKQYGLIAAGTLVTFTLLITFNFILPTGFKILTFIPFGAVFILPFVACTGYAIARYRLFNTRVVITEIFSFVIVIATLLQLVLSSSTLELMLRGAVFILVLIFDILLIKRTVSEVQSRELIEKQEKELEVTNSRLRELDKQKTEFLSYASHQLRTPLTAIKWSAAAILDKTYGDVPKNLSEPLRTIYSESALMAVFINDYLNVTRIEQGKMEYRFVPVNLCSVLVEAEKELRGSIEGKGLSLNVQCDEDRVMVWADPDKLTQVFTNLIDNAVKYTPKGTITLALKKDTRESRVLVEIADTGIGMDEATRQKIFSKFIRGENAIALNSAGSGLGLFIVKTFVEAHKGTVRIESSGLGKGSRFIIELPLLVQLGTK
jgi:signal transduction histidine kinase